MESFLCDYCHRSFTRKYNLRMHIEKVHTNSKCKCSICDQQYGNYTALQLHLSRGHNSVGTAFPECDLCGRIFKRRQNILSHMLSVHCDPVKTVPCQECNKLFTTKRNLRRHLYQMHATNMKYGCDICSKVFSQKVLLINHLGSHNNSAHKCSVCLKVFASNRNLRRHIYRTHSKIDKHDEVSEIASSKSSLINSDSENEIELNCFECNERFDNELSIRIHIKTKHSFTSFYKYCKNSLLRKTGSEYRKMRILNCEFCLKEFTNVYMLKVHMKINHDKEYSLWTCNVCFTRLYCEETAEEHRKGCIPPEGVHHCLHCEKLFTDRSSLMFHLKIFHPQALVTDSVVTSTQDCQNDGNMANFACELCDRVYFSDRSLKHHIKLKHTTNETVICEICSKLCSNKYYLASHMKVVHADQELLKCQYCEKLFRTKRNIRRHIEYTHLGTQRHKCLVCDSLFKEKRSLRKHVRSKHPNSNSFSRCHLCEKTFESAKACKIHLKIMHSYNLNTHPCPNCSVSFSEQKSLKIHLQSNHSAEDEIFKCDKCSAIFRGSSEFEEHKITHHPKMKTSKSLPQCALCIKDFSTRKTLKRHIKKFHSDFEANMLADYGMKVKPVDCANCTNIFTEDTYQNFFRKVKMMFDTTIFTCNSCFKTYNALDYAIQRYRFGVRDAKDKVDLSNYCTAEMSDEDDHDVKDFVQLKEEIAPLEPESTTQDFIKQEPNDFDYDIKEEPKSPIH